MKKSEIVFHQTETEESNPKFIEIQIRSLTT